MSGPSRRVGARARLAGGVVAVLVLASRAHAFYLDTNQDFDLRLRAYAETAVAAEVSEPQTKPKRSPFQVIENRYFMEPEFDAKLTQYQPWPWQLDDFSFRLALWGFYDGIYEYGTSQYVRAVRSIQGRISQGHTQTAPVTRTDHADQSLEAVRLPARSRPRRLRRQASPFRINEAYFNFTKGPLFLRIGRQAISWGESDTDRAARRQQPLQPDARHSGRVPGHRRGPHPAMDGARDVQSVQLLGADLERVRRGVPRAREHRHDGEPAAAAEGEPLLAAAGRPADV